MGTVPDQAASSAGQAAPSTSVALQAAGRLQGYAGKLADGLITGVPAALITWLTASISGQLTAEPWRMAVVVLPLGIAAWLFWRKARAGGSLRLRGHFQLFLVCYLAAFGVAAGSDLLTWRRTLVGFDAAGLPRNWLGLGRLGDWRYHLLPPMRADPQLLVVTMPPLADGKVDSARFEIARLVGFASASGARGVAFDFYPDTVTSGADGLLCSALARSRIPVLFGYRTGTLLGRPARVPYAPALERCIPPEARGHLLGYREPGRLVRHVPLRLDEPPGAKALSLLIAERLAPSPVPDAPHGSRLLQYLEPRGGFTPVTYQDLRRLRNADRSALEGRFLIVGEDSPRERFRTPWGERLGVQVHASAVQTLLAGRSLHRAAWWATLLVIVLGCYLITAQAAVGAAARRLWLLAAAVSGFTLAAAALAARLHVWLDVAYVLASTGLLVALLLPLRRRLAGTG